MMRYSLGGVTRVVSVFAVTVVAALALTSCQPDDTQGVVVGNQTTPTVAVPDAKPSASTWTPTGYITPPSSNRIVTTTNCGPNAKLPAGIDSRVCSKYPGAATTLYPSGMFTTPSRNIACNILADQYDIYSGEVRCIIFKTTFARPPAAANTGNIMGAWLNNEARLNNGQAEMGFYASDDIDSRYAVRDNKPITTLNYGQIASAGRAWCLSQSVGLTCWDDRTGHGFFLSQASYSVW